MREPHRVSRFRGPAGRAIFGALLLAATVWCAADARSAAAAPAVAGGAVRAQPGREAAQRVLDDFGKLPLSFEANQGQTDPTVDFVARGAGYNLFLTPSEAVLSWPEPSSTQVSRIRTLRMEILRAATSAVGVGLDPLAGKSHYLRGTDPAGWHTDVPSYARIRYGGVYPGVDLVYFGKQRQLEYEFVVAPGSDPRVIRLAFHGADRLWLDKQGNLLLKVGDHQVLHAAPFIYQEIDGVGRRVAGGYVLKSPNEVAFAVAPFDATRPLIIDPPVQLAYSTLLGGNGDDRSLGIAIDGAGNSYVTGTTVSPEFPTANALQATKDGASDAFVVKLNAAGSALVYSTFLGGIGPDNGSGVAVDAAGNAYVVGNTGSPDFPTTVAAFQQTFGGVQDAFVTKLNPTGSALVYSTFVGGLGRDLGLDIALDAGNNVYLTGRTQSLDFPTTLLAFQTSLAGGQDAYVAKINALGSALVYSTYLGGTANELGLGIAVDSFGSAYVTGATRSSDFPTSGPFQAANAGSDDAFVAKLDPLGATLEYATFLGGSGEDCGNAIAVDGANAFVTGETRSTDFPTQSPFQAANAGSADAFVTKLSVVGSTLIYSTYLGGIERDAGSAIAIDGAGNAFVAGGTRSGDYPTAGQGPPFITGGGMASCGLCFPFDAFLSRLDSGGVLLLYSRRIGGLGVDGAEGIAVDAEGAVYLTGFTQSLNFRTTGGAPQGQVADGNDAFVVKLTSGN